MYFGMWGDPLRGHESGRGQLGKWTGKGGGGGGGVSFFKQTGK